MISLVIFTRRKIAESFIYLYCLSILFDERLSFSNDIKYLWFILDNKHLELPDVQNDLAEFQKLYGRIAKPVAITGVLKP